MSETKAEFMSYIVYMPDGETPTAEAILDAKQSIDAAYNAGYRFYEAIDLYAMDVTVMMFKLEDERAAEPI